MDKILDISSAQRSPNPNPDAVAAKVRPARSSLYRWYDSIWLEKYTLAKAIIKRVKPEALGVFEETLRVFHTRPDFKVKLLEQVLDDEALGKLRHVVKSLKPTDFELHEVHRFKRFVVHDHPLVSELQAALVSLVSDEVGEAVESSYNFLSLYSGMGVCPLHMDSPEAKWTLDLCLNQSEAWPIYFSQVQRWPEIDPDVASPEWAEGDWEEAIKQSAAMNFSSHTMNPGQALLFSGSSQWHYRNAMPSGNVNSFCDLLFFHFIPRGTRSLLRPENWAQVFNIPELATAASADASATP